MLKKLLREPLVHFLLLGTLLFVIGGRLDLTDPSDDRIEVTPQRVQQLGAIFQRTWQRPPTASELRGLVDDFVKEEIYVREARAMGLDRDDTVIRRRLRQKLEFLTEDAGAAAPLGDEDLQAYLDENRKRYQIPPSLALEQVFFSVDRRGEEGARAASTALLERLRGTGVDLGQAGDRLPLTLPDRPTTPAQWARILGLQESSDTWLGQARTGAKEAPRTRPTR